MADGETYVLDLAAGLTQVLADPTTTYLYSATRIGADSTTWTYYHADALGSVRALSDASGQRISAHAYSPYGDPTTAAPDEFGYTGEQVGAGGLVFLRALTPSAPFCDAFARDEESGVVSPVRPGKPGGESRQSRGHRQSAGKGSDPTTSYLYGAMRIAADSTTWTYYHTDGLGSVRALSDATGQPISARAYSPTRPPPHPTTSAIRASKSGPGGWCFCGRGIMIRGRGVSSAEILGVEIQHIQLH